MVTSTTLNITFRSPESQELIRQVGLADLPITLGRGQNAGISIHDRWASRLHCEIDEVDGILVVRDLGATNGTLVNGRCVSRSHLMPGDKLNVGMTTLEVQYEIGQQHQPMSGNGESQSDMTPVQFPTIDHGSSHIFDGDDIGRPAGEESGTLLDPKNEHSHPSTVSHVLHQHEPQ